MSGAPWVVVRCRNDIRFLDQTLMALRGQTIRPRILFADNASTDGSRELGRMLSDALLDVPDGSYIPGSVLNEAMGLTDGEFVSFLNSDCTPTHSTWLERLLAGFHAPEVGAVFGRQDPRPGCFPIFAKDTYDTFGDGSRQVYWKHAYSMASSAIRRARWEDAPFRTDIQYSEDIDWTWRMRQAGHSVRYVPDSVVLHSHNYTPRQWYRRQYGEGRAEARIFAWTSSERGILRYTFLPLARQVVTDCWYALKRLRLDAMVASPIFRIAQAIGRRRGFLRGIQS